MYQYNLSLQQALEENEMLNVLVEILVFLLILIFIRNLYNLIKKRSYRKKFKTLEKQYKSDQETIVIQQEDLDILKTESLNLERKLNEQKKYFTSKIQDKEEELKKRESNLEYQRNAFEKYAGFKIVDANNSRLGAHFLKNVISHIYEDLEEIHSSQMSSEKLNAEAKTLLPIKALKDIFTLLDYTVAVIQRDTVSINEEIKHIQLFIAVINYLKPKTTVDLTLNLTLKDLQSLQIRPTLFFPFIENALKHGDLNRDDSKIIIEADIKSDNRLIYTVLNSCECISVAKKETDGKNEFGLNALKNLLDTYYPKNELESRPITHNLYLSKLVIPVN
ncbi:hypothetical protein [Leeuwenhoekiella sp. W20_SRS_FM14]|uniref:hypothetical protein n=1 Tax=Leeuwenhoekiella sp. W20_SRS_FM14 TaxID=3240270 RepID=UPI003F9BE6A5